MQKFTILERDFSVPGGELGKNRCYWCHVEYVYLSINFILSITQSHEFAVYNRSHTEAEAPCGSEEVCGPS